MSKPAISAIVHTYNAAQHLERCLACLRAAKVDEILLVDMESTDDTLDIARRAGARIVVKPRGEYRIADVYRDFAIHEARHDWVLVVDADELVPAPLVDYLRAEVERDPSPRGYLIPIKNYFMGKWMRCSYPDHILRFFNRNGATWPAHIHSRPQIQGPLATIPASRTDLAFVHLANESVARTLDKMNRYTDLEMERRRTRYSPMQLITGPTWRFFKTFILKGSVLQGWPGLIKAVNDATYRFTAMAKIEEERRKGLPSDLDKDISDTLKQQ